MQDLENPSAGHAADLLAELDHRVKNNLQLIASIVLLQLQRTKDEAARQALKSALARVTAVATVHRSLFQGDPHLFDVADFLRDLVGDLAASAGRDDIQITLDLQPVAIAASSAAAFALTAGELLSNALKHAFPAGRGGRIAVTLADHDGACVLAIADDGVGLGDAPAGFGLTVAGLLAQQLRAVLELAPGDSQAGSQAGPQLGRGVGVRATLNVPAPRDGAS